MRPRLLPRLIIATSLALATCLSSVARAEDEEAARVREALVAAVKSPAQLGKALAQADSLVGPSATFPDVGALSDWLGTLPAEVTGLEPVRIRRAWLYVSARRGTDAIPLLEPSLAANPKDALLRSYRGEARRQAGDVPGAVEDLVQALKDGAADDAVLPSARKLVYDLKRSAPKEPTPGLPAYATAGAPLLSMRAMPDVEQALVEWLTFDATLVKGDKKHAALLRAEAARHAGAALRSAPAEGERLRLARMALDAAAWVETLGAEAPSDLPTRFDFLAAAVRLGERNGVEGHDLPEALTSLAAEALAKGRYVLAERMARRRLEISDSPASRRVLLALPPDVGD